ncbi:PREDICTED: tyrocidine synthase 2-like [Priapulus caudatus]|uniref:Tyrocidine synthase 2-like n=1 Tax=Priapulus caudatus TaxID=37621 RepID=A0ABM1F4I0_PRICU|nr:PREDICTED: tyrocidine synthase 2-like [Priapulus caudatus]
MSSLLRGERLDLPSFHSLHGEFLSLVENSCVRVRPALTHDGRTVNFAQLRLRAGRISSFLREIEDDERILKGSDSRRRNIVAVCMQPSDALVAAILGVLASGAAYLPLDASAPRERCAYVLDDARPLCVLVDAKTTSIHDAVRCCADAVAVYRPEDIDRWQSASVCSGYASSEFAQCGEGDVACVLYTSGSTGRPKGVRLTHGMSARRRAAGRRAQPAAVRRLAARSRRHAPHACALPAAHDHAVRRGSPTSRRQLASLRFWVCSGETLPPRLLAEFFRVFPRGKTLCNFYGSTEVTGDVTWQRFRGMRDVTENLRDNRVPIGRPINNTDVVVVGDDLRPVGGAEIGEICVSGRNVAAGYVTEMAGQFVDNPLGGEREHSVLYRTGDYGRVIDGTLYYEGRHDAQVKIRGRRVDLTEIERAFSEISGVCNAVVLVDATSADVLAFYTASGTAPLSTDAVRSTLATKLPAFMMPRLLHVTHVPLLHNGKTDREALMRQYQQQLVPDVRPSSALDAFSGSTGNSAHADAVVIIGSVLGLHASAADIAARNFFDIGGNSINAIVCIVKLREANFSIGIDDFLRAPTIADVAHLVTRQADTASIGGDLPSNIDICSNPCSKFKIIRLSEAEQPRQLITVLSESFSTKNPLDRAVNNNPETHAALLRSLWQDIVRTQLTLVAIDARESIVGGVICFDLFDEPTLDAPPLLAPIFDLHEVLEDNFRRRMAGTGTRWLHNSLMGTDLALSYQDNVLLIKAMEEAVLCLARSEEFTGVFTCNSNKLNQDICQHFLGFDEIGSYRVQDFVYEGRHVFSDAKDDDVILSMIKYV